VDLTKKFSIHQKEPADGKPQPAVSALFAETTLKLTGFYGA
jgi:hypothetical protein